MYTGKQISTYNSYHTNLFYLISTDICAEEFQEVLEGALRIGFPVDYVPLFDTKLERKFPLFYLALTRYKTAYSHTAEERALAKAKLLLDAGADVNALYVNALYFAIENNMPYNFIVELIGKTKNPDAKCGYNGKRTALGILCEKYIFSIVIKDRERNGLSSDTQALSNLIRLMISKGADPDADPYWCQPFQTDNVFDRANKKVVEDLKKLICLWQECAQEYSGTETENYEYEL